MFTLSRHIDVPAPVEQVFDFHADPRNLLKVSPPFIRTHLVSVPDRLHAGAHIELRARLGLYPEGVDPAGLMAGRQQDRELLIEAMAAAGVRPHWPVERFEPAFAAAVHAFVASTASSLVAVQAEDLLAMTDPVNVPGTSSEYPNWRRKLSGDFAELLRGDSARPIVETMRRLRPG